MFCFFFVFFNNLKITVFQSNAFWGWGGEDVEMFWRIKKGLNLTISEADPQTTLFDMLKHKHWGEKDNKPNPNRKKLVFTWRTWKTHGLNELNYTKLETHHCSLFTRFLVDTHPPSFVGKRLSKNKGQQKSGQQKAWSRKLVINKTG